MTTVPRRLLLAVLAFGGLAACAVAAWAVWTAGGSGTAVASVGSLAAPGAPSASVSAGTVTLTWTASTPPGSGTVGYSVERRPQPGSTWSNVCGTSASSHITSATCADAPGAGTFVWRVTAYFHSWTAVSSASPPAVVGDTTPPTGTVTAPLAGAAVRGSVAVTSNSADTESGVASALFQVSGAGAGSWSNVAAADTTSPYGVTWVTTSFADGLYDLRVVTTDNAGNVFTSASLTNVRVDNTAPSVSLALAPGASGAFKSGTVVSFKANAAGSFGLVATVTDAGSGPASATFPVQSTSGWTHAAETVSTPTGGPYASSSFVWSSGASTPGSYTVTVSDAVGNTATSAVTFTVDTTAPTGSVTAPASASIVRGSAVSVTSSSADGGSGVASALFQISPAGAGTWSSLGAADVVSPYATNWDTTSFADGLYDLRVVTTDNVGNAFTSATIASVRVDNTAPTGAVTFPTASAAVRATVTVTSTSADGGSGVASALFQISAAGAGTWSNVATADTTSPYTASWVTTGYAAGLYDLRVVTTDNAGNVFTSPVVSNVLVDNTAPSVSLALAPGATGAFKSGTVVYFRANAAGSFGLVATVTDGGSGPASATFPVQSTSGWTHAAETVSTPVGGPYSSSSFAWSSGASKPSTYTVTVSDAAGNTATSAVTFAIDSTAPTGSVTAPAAAANVRGSAVSVTSSSADGGSGVASVQFQSSPAGAGTWSNLGPLDVASPYTTTWDTTTFTDGLYDLRVTTVDNVGNTFTSATIASVRVDNTAPTGAVTAPASNAFLSGTAVAVSASSADGGSGVQSAQFQTSPRGAGTWSSLGSADTTSPYGVTWNTTSGYPDGLYDVRVVTTDKAGNTFTSAVVPVEIQNAAPTVTALALVDGGGTVGRAEQGDQIVVTYSQTLSVSSMCSAWSGNLTDQSLLTVGDVSVTLTDGGVANDTVTVASGTCTFHFGTINLGATGYVTGGNRVFSGLTTSTRSTIAWSAVTHRLTITLGAPSGSGVLGTIGSSVAGYTADAAIKNVVGAAIAGVFSTAAQGQF